jgi:heat shock protein HslJ
LLASKAIAVALACVAACAGIAPADTPLRGTYWKLVRLGDQPAEAAEKPREAHLVFADDSQRVSGSGGCNRVIGQFTLEGDKLQIGRMAATLMACPTGMAQEQALVKALARVERYRIRGSHLELLDAAGEVLLRFEAVALI